MRSLFVIHLGPVQGFIASARRSRDLQSGSWLLSELSKAAARAVAQHDGLDSLIFPHPSDASALQEGSGLGVANKVVALIGSAPEDLGPAVYQRVIERLRALKDVAFSKVEGRFDRDSADRQVDDLVEFFWVSVPLAEADDYARARAQADALMAARKTTRDFGPVTWGSSVPKSSLDGLRESVIPESAYDDLRAGRLTEEGLRRLYGVGKGERLCGVGLLKRHMEVAGQGSFYSTSHVAALPLLQRMRASGKVDAEEYVRRLLELGMARRDLALVSGRPHPAFGLYDGGLLFRERLDELFSDQAVLADARQALNTFLKRAVDGHLPQPYYALLAADGDRMGRMIDNQKGMDDHRRLSRTLARFAASVPGVVSRHQGALVYAGGDDVLAFLPLHTALPCARELAAGFRMALAGLHDADGKPATLSAGVVVSHHMGPLSEALHEVRRAEQIAKTRGGRDALAITVVKRSGAPRTVVGKWGTLDERVERFSQMHRLDAIPDGAAYELSRLARQLAVPRDHPHHRVLQEAAAAEAVRILQRKRPKHGTQEAITGITRAYLEELARKLPVSQLADELVVARIFADAADLAGLSEVEEVTNANVHP